MGAVCDYYYKQRHGRMSQATSPVTLGATLGCCLNYLNHPVKDDCPRRLVRGLIILKGHLPLKSLQ